MNSFTLRRELPRTQRRLRYSTATSLMHSAASNGHADEPKRFDRRLPIVPAFEADSPSSTPRVRPRVAHVITRLIVGGAQENTLASVVELRRRGRYDADLILGPTYGPEGSLVPSALDQGVEPQLVPSLRREVNPLLDSIALAKLVGMFRRGGFDLVHTHSSKAGVLGRLAARLAGVPVVVHTVHGWGFNDRQRPLVNRSFTALERWCARFTDALVTVTPRDTDVGLSRGIGEPALYTTIRSGIDLARFGSPQRSREEMRAELGLAGHHRVAVSVMRLVPQKAPLDLIDGAGRLLADLPDARILIVGDGPLRALVEDRCRALGLGNRIVFTGLRSDVPELLAAADVLVLASLWEGLPRVIPQAMAAGLPVVATAVAGNAEAVADGVTGVLVPPRDPAALASALSVLLADPARSRAMGAAARARVDEFSVHRMVDDIEALYTRCLAIR